MVVYEFVMEVTEPYAIPYCMFRQLFKDRDEAVEYMHRKMQERPHLTWGQAAPNDDCWFEAEDSEQAYYEARVIPLDVI